MPEGSRYPHLDLTVQYDSVADKPTRWGWYSMINASTARHYAYFDPGVDINDPGNWVFAEGKTTYLLAEADVLPMLKWRDWVTSDAEMARLDAKYRPLVEKDYDRPAYVQQGEGADWAEGVKPTILRDPGDETDDGDHDVRGTSPRRSVLAEGNEQVTATHIATDTNAATKAATETAEADEVSTEPTSASDPEPSATASTSESAKPSVQPTTPVRGARGASESPHELPHHRSGGEPTTDTAPNGDEAPAPGSSSDGSSAAASEGGSSAGDAGDS